MGKQVEFSIKVTMNERWVKSIRTSVYQMESQ